MGVSAVGRWRAHCDRASRYGRPATGRIRRRGVEANLVAHSGPSARGSLIQTLVLRDIATDWTECAPLLVREQTLLSTALTELRRQLPFSLQGIDTDNDSVRNAEGAFCEQANIIFTRCRPYRTKRSGICRTEERNRGPTDGWLSTVEGPEADALLAELYCSVRLFVNFS